MSSLRASPRSRCGRLEPASPWRQRSTDSNGCRSDALEDGRGKLTGRLRLSVRGTKQRDHHQGAHRRLELEAQVPPAPHRVDEP